MKKRSFRIMLQMQLWVLIAALCISMVPNSALSEALKIEDETQNGYIETAEGYFSEVAWCANGDESIFGKFYYPLDFNAEKQYPVIIMSHGVSVTH